MLPTILNNAFAAVQKLTAQKAATESPQPLAAMQKQRARDWLDELAAAFRAEYARSAQYRVLSKDNVANVPLGLDDLPNDIAVVRVGKIKSAELDNELEYVSEVLWQVQSNFSTDTKAAVCDFNRLVLGSAASRLLVAPIVHSPSFLRTLAVPAAACKNAEVYLAMIAHPSRWPAANEPVRLFKFDGRKWEAHKT